MNSLTYTIKYSLITSLLLVQAYISGSYLSSYLAYLITTLLLVYNFGNLYKLSKGKIKIVPSNADILILLFIIALLRSYLNETLNINDVLYYIIVILLFSTIIRFDIQKINFWKILFNSFSIILFLNIILFFFGINDSFWSKIGVAQYSRPLQKLRLLSMLDADFYRTGFFVFNNFAYYSMLIGLLIISLFSGNYKPNKFMSIFILIFSIMSIMLLDARGPILFVLLVWVLRKKILKINKKNFPVIYLSILLIPFIFSIAMLFLGYSVDDLTSFASSRDIIWGSFLLNYNPNLSQLFFGYGFLGQNISGISNLYENMFSDRGNSSNIISLHNNYLQYIMDIGIIGLFFLFRILYKTIIKMDFLNLKKLKPLLFYTILVGTLEMGIIINNTIIFYFFLALIYYVDYRFHKITRQQKIIKIQ